jgi:hypothetical protein
MGASRTDVILDDDVVADVYADFMERFDQGIAPEDICAELEDEYADTLGNVDDGPAIWLALALAQWECGQLEPDMLAKVSEIVASGVELERWKEEWRDKRKQALAAFLEQISPNPHQRRPGQGDEES